MMKFCVSKYLFIPELRTKFQLPMIFLPSFMIDYLHATTRVWAITGIVYLKTFNEFLSINMIFWHVLKLSTISVRFLFKKNVKYFS